MPDSSGQRRIDWLDGVRGAAAMFVVLHHVWHRTWHDFPVNSGPWPLGWLLYGHLAVAVFIVVSGFSLALAPLGHGDRLVAGVGRFLRRRAWRIIPAYWAALLLSTAISLVLLRPDTGIGAISRSILVHGLLIQDLVPSVQPNGAFWSIAVEWQIYFLFPVILWVARSTSIAVSAAATTVIVVAAHLAAQLDSPLYRIDHVSPQFLALFAFGVLAAKVSAKPVSAERRRVLGATVIAVLAAVVVAANTAGSVWIVERFFWVDLVFGLGAACLLTLLAVGGAAPLRVVLRSRAGVFLGGFSYSLYLVHDPLLHLFDEVAINPLGVDPLLRFTLLFTVGVPIVVMLCYGFHLLFEKPFLVHRDRRAFGAIPFVRLLRRGAPIAASATGKAEAPASA